MWAKGVWAINAKIAEKKAIKSSVQFFFMSCILISLVPIFIYYSPKLFTMFCIVHSFSMNV